MVNSETGRRAVDAGRRFLARRGYEIVDPDPAGCEIVARDGGCIVFVRVLVRVGADEGFPEGGSGARGDLERAAARWLTLHPEEVDAPVRFDVVSMLVLSRDRALIRHHVNALADPEA